MKPTKPIALLSARHGINFFVSAANYPSDTEMRKKNGLVDRLAGLYTALPDPSYTRYNMDWEDGSIPSTTLFTEPNPIVLAANYNANIVPRMTLIRGMIPTATLCWQSPLAYFGCEAEYGGHAAWLADYTKMTDTIAIQIANGIVSSLLSSVSIYAFPIYPTSVSYDNQFSRLAQYITLCRMYNLKHPVRLFTSPWWLNNSAAPLAEIGGEVPNSFFSRLRTFAFANNCDIELWAVSSPKYLYYYAEWVAGGSVGPAPTPEYATGAQIAASNAWQCF